MKVLEVKTALKDYPIYIDHSYDELVSAFEKSGLKPSKLCIITVTNVEKYYLETIESMLSEKFDVCHYVFEAGENSKHLGTISDFYNFFVEEKLDRKSVVVALGGGVVGDMAGFAASTYMRGISFVQVPTTLLAQVDSSVGGKTGVDFNGNKNMIGAFYQPDFVFINSETLKTLPYREVAAGIAEAIKYGYIIDKDFLEYCIENKESIKSLDNNALIEVIYKCCEAKAYVVSKDEKELGLRAILNFGHTFGHSVETLNNFKLLHGECVAIGMVAALYYSMECGNTTKEDIENIEKLLEFFELPTRCDNNVDEVYNQMFYDKKTSSGKIKIVALKKIGEAFIDSSNDVTNIKKAIEYIAK